jgi:hypothetical protein
MEQSTNFAEASIEDYDERRAKQLEFWKAQNGRSMQTDLSTSLAFD